MTYKLLRNFHLLFGVIALPFLLMYGVSAVQMGHQKWFNLKPAVQVAPARDVGAGLTDAFDVVGRLGVRGDVRGKLPKFRVVVPGVVHDITYVASTGMATVSTSRSPVMGVLNRLHHAAGFWPAYLPLQLWGAAIAVVSLAVVGLAITGLWMWWQRKQDRVLGVVLLAANAGFALVVLAMIRSAGP